MSKEKFTKKMAEKAHFKNRMQERFGIIMNRHDIRELVQDICHGNNIICTEHLSNRVDQHTMIYNGHKMNILYDKNRKVPITVKTLDMETTSYSGSTQGIVRMFR